MLVLPTVCTLLAILVLVPDLLLALLRLICVCIIVTLMYWAVAVMILLSALKRVWDAWLDYVHTHSVSL